MAQHHDAVAGTERQHVAYDYAQRIAKGMAGAYRTLDEALSRLSANGSAEVAFHSCPLLNVSICPTIRQASDNFTVLLYNPQARGRLESVTLPIYTVTDVTVTDSAGRVVPSEVVPVYRTSASTGASATRAVVFTPASPIPGLGFEAFTVHPVPTAGAVSTTPLQRLRRREGREEAAEVGGPIMRPPTTAQVSIQNSQVRLTFDNATGRLQSWTDLTTKAEFALSQDVLYYNASVSRDYGISTLYTFQVWPNTTLFPINAGAIPLTAYIGTRVQMVFQRWNDWLSQTWRLYSDRPYPEVEWTVGPIAFEDGLSREIVSRYTTDIASRGEMWTDANGREFQRRVRNQRPSYNFTLPEVSKIVANYYPVSDASYTAHHRVTRHSIVQDMSHIFSV